MSAAIPIRPRRPILYRQELNALAKLTAEVQEVRVILERLESRHAALRQSVVERLLADAEIVE